jgi:hypothetical protein
MWHAWERRGVHIGFSGKSRRKETTKRTGRKELGMNGINEREDEAKNEDTKEMIHH